MWKRVICPLDKCNAYIWLCPWYMCSQRWVRFRGMQGGALTAASASPWIQEGGCSESIMGTPCESRDPSDTAFVSRHNVEPIRVSITVTLILADQSDSHARFAASKACFTSVLLTCLINGLLLQSKPWKYPCFYMLLATFDDFKIYIYMRYIWTF